jgi:hypothetical protein
MEGPPLEGPFYEFIAALPSKQLALACVRKAVGDLENEPCESNIPRTFDTALATSVKNIEGEEEEGRPDCGGGVQWWMSAAYLQKMAQWCIAAPGSELAFLEDGPKEWWICGYYARRRSAFNEATATGVLYPGMSEDVTLTSQLFKVDVSAVPGAPLLGGPETWPAGMPSKALTGELIASRLGCLPCVYVVFTDTIPHYESSTPSTSKMRGVFATPRETLRCMRKLACKLLDGL